MQTKDILQMDEAELLQIATNDPEMVKGVLTDIISVLQSEMSRMESTLSDLTQRSSVLLTIAGLFTFLPSLVDLGTNYLQYFLLSTFPLLILGIYFFYQSSVRVNSFLSSFPVVPRGTSTQLLLLRAQAIALEQIWTLMKTKYDDVVLPNYRLLSATIYAYFLSFAVGLFYFAFFGLPPMQFFILNCVVEFCLVYFLVEIRARKSGQISLKVPIEPPNKVSAA